jgi:hypothetical protein
VRCALGPLDRPVEFWALKRRQHEESDALLPAEGSKGGDKSTAAIGLNGTDRKRDTLLEAIEKVRGRRRRGPTVDRQAVPPGDHVAGREVCENPPGQRPDIESVHFRHIDGRRTA